MSDYKNICVVEDDYSVAESLMDYFSMEGYKVSHFDSYSSFMNGDFSSFKGLYLIDWNLPDKPGIEIVTKIREQDKVSPLFLISGYSQKEDIIEGLKVGADDYITKPFNFDELLARIENALSKYSVVEGVIQTSEAGLKLLPEAKSFIKDGKTVSLTAREYNIFECLYKNQDGPTSREELTKQFSSSDKITERNIDVHVFSLRKKIADAGMKIETVWKKGYKLNF